MPSMGGAASGAMSGAGTGMMFGPWGAAIGAGIGGLMGLFGGGGKSEPQPTNIWAMNEGQRQGLAGMGYDQMGRIYGGDPNAFWGGQGAWTTAVGGGDLTGQLMGGGGVSAQGYSPGMANAHLAQFYGADPSFGQTFTSEADLIDLNSDIYQLEMPDELSKMMGGRIARRTNAQAADAQRGLMDRLRLSGHGGDTSSPWSQSLMANIDRSRLNAIAEANVTGELGWSLPAAERQHGARAQNSQLGTQVGMFNAGQQQQGSQFNAGQQQQTNLFNAGGQMDISKFNAGSQNQIGMFNTGQGNEAARFGAASRQSAQAQNAAMGQAGAEFLMRMRGSDEDRMLQRYGMLHNMNMDWQRPQAQAQMGPAQPSTMDRILGGVGAGLQLYGGLKNLGVFGNPSGSPTGGGGGSLMDKYGIEPLW